MLLALLLFLSLPLSFPLPPGSGSAASSLCMDKLATGNALAQVSHHGLGEGEGGEGGLGNDVVILSINCVVLKPPPRLTRVEGMSALHCSV